MKILVINHYAGSPRHGMEYRPFFLAREWQRAGHSVTIAAASKSHLRSANPVCRGIATSESVEGIRYIWYWTPPYRRNGIPRALNMGVFLLQLLVHIRSLAGRCRDGVVIASSTYVLDVIVAFLIAKLAKAKLVFEVRDLWPLTIIELGRISPRNPLIRLLQRAADFGYCNAHSVISVLQNAEPYMRSRGLPPGRFTYVPNGVEMESWNEDGELPPLHQEIIDGARRSGHFIVGYAGRHGRANALGYIIRAAERLTADPITFVFVGEGVEKERLKRLAAELNLRNVEFLPTVPRAAVPRFLASMDALILSWERSSLYRFGISPNKLFDYMMAGKPIIHAVEAPNDPVLETGCGISVPPEDPGAIAAAVLKLTALSPEARAKMGENGRLRVRAVHDYKVLAARFLDAIAVEQPGNTNELCTPA
jgi:glycosyltransferase involved in cell wall biosynthesis